MDELTQADRAYARRRIANADQYRSVIAPVPVPISPWEAPNPGEAGQPAAQGPTASARRLVSVGNRSYVAAQDRDAARPLLWNLDRTCTHIRLAWADAGYAGKLTTRAATTLKITVEIVRKRDARAFQVLPRRWVAERTYRRVGSQEWTSAPLALRPGHCGRGLWSGRRSRSTAMVPGGSSGSAS